MRANSLFLSAFAIVSAGFVAAEDLKIEVTKAVECDRATKAGDAISVHYIGSFTDGKVFESSYEGDPFKFTLGMGAVIDGWDQGLLDMCIGEKRKLTIPPELAYGDRPVGPIPANSILVFETELMAIDGVEPPAEDEEEDEDADDEEEDEDDDSC